MSRGTEKAEMNEAILIEWATVAAVAAAAFALGWHGSGRRRRSGG